jgi:predicted MFS family arabinose efflux permease
MLRWRPSRILLVGTLGTAGGAPLFALLAIHAPVWVIAAAALVAGVGMETFGVLWDTAMQQQIPQDRLSRVSSYDALGSFVFIPIGAAAAGPLAAAFGLETTLWAGAVLVLLCTLSMLAVGDVRSLRRTPSEAYTEAEARSAAAS